MACSKTKFLAGKIWPLYRTTKSGLCCYVVEDSREEVEAAVADAQTRPDYVRRSKFFELPDNKVHVKLYFRQSRKIPTAPA